jgi:hypothetical protein
MGAAPALLRRYCAPAVTYLSEDVPVLLKPLGLALTPFAADGPRPRVVIVGLAAAHEEPTATLLAWAAAGTRVIFLLDRAQSAALSIGDLRVGLKPIGGGLAPNALSFVARDEKAALTREFRPTDFAFWYNAESDMLDFVAEHTLDAEGLTPLVFTYQKPGFFVSASGPKQRLPVVGSLAWGQGELIFSTLCLPGRVGCNPVLDRFLRTLMEQ